MTSPDESVRLCPYSDPALCRICVHDCNARELADLIGKLEEATLRVRLALVWALRRIASLSHNGLHGGPAQG